MKSRSPKSVFTPLLALVIFTLSTGCLQKKTDDANTSAVQGAGQYSITHFEPTSMPPECNPPPGYDRNEGVAIIEGDPMVDGAKCTGFASPGIPDCTKVLKEKKLCGRTYKITVNGMSKNAYLTGICPWDHKDNAGKGQWNPCGRHRKNHLDIMDGLYYSLGLSDAQSWGPNGNTGTVNPSTVYAQIEKLKDVPGVTPVHN